ncbi:TOMM precursor leader peptide-binding protein [Streptomyces sp. NPDC007264]|uniref:TOMM precursor leader peptide-binding protein n=1 Tax=Streptomyces sp. NPDC007264 TaxID=3364777 RepID=UPI0036D94711
MTTVIGTAPDDDAPPDAPPDAPLEAARLQLQQALDEWISRTGPLPPGAPGPVVVPLGTADAGAFDGDPYRSLRRRANVHLAADAVLVGPWGGADDDTAACGNCLALRWQRLRSRSQREALETGGGLRAAGGWPLLTGYLVDPVWALYQQRMVPGAATAPARPADDPRAADPRAAADLSLPQVSRLDLATLRVETVPLLPDPLCPVCARPGPERAPDAVLALRSRPKPAPGVHRLRPAASYPVPTRALANPVCGALGARVHLNVTSPTTAPVSGAAFVRGYAGLTDVNWSGQTNAYASSRDLAYLEGLERYAGTHRRRGTLPVVDSWENLREEALDPRTCGEYAPETYRDDPAVRPFDPTRAIPWVWGWSLRDERALLVPVRLVHYSAQLRDDGFVFECSNGCATGSCVEEAILHGLLELIERDAFLLHWYGGGAATEIDLSGLESGPVRAMADRAALRGYRLHAFDSRVDLAIPVVTGLAVRRDGGPGHLSFAAAAAFDPAQAAEAALSEVLTYIPHLAQQVRDHRPALERMVEDYDEVRHLPDHARLFGLPQMARHARTYLEPAAVRTAGELYGDWEGVRPRSGDLLDDLRYCLDRLVGAGHDVVVVDQTTPEQERVGLRTVATIVPGLLPIDFGWRRQRALRMPRLRTAFRRAGMRGTDLAETEIRRVPHPFP